MDKDFFNGKRLYLESHGSAIVTNRWLLVIMALSVLLHICQGAFAWAVYAHGKEKQPLIVRIDQVGNATAVNYNEFEYKPQDRELRYFLIHFVTNHFSRIPATVNEKYANSLFFMERSLAEKTAEEERRSQEILRFIRESNEDIDIEVKNVALTDLRSTPMRAAVTFEKVFSSRGDHRELRRELYQGTFEFVVQENVPNEWTPVNPLGLTITYFRVDQGFEGRK